jgi:hypothetical protein
MAIDPHAKVTSVAQDDWVQLAEVLYANCLRLAMLPGMEPEHVTATIATANKARQFHILCLTFDDDVDAMRARCQKFQESQP